MSPRAQGGPALEAPGPLPLAAPCAAGYVPAMRRYQQLEDLPATAKGASIAIGNFDGVHLGHQAVIDAAP